MQDISMSDFTSEILPREALIMIFPFTVEETKRSLNISLLRLSKRLLRLFSCSLLALFMSMVESRALTSSEGDFSISGL